MKLEEMYAQALYGADTTEPKKALESLRQMLARRGHEKLLPRIFSEYQKLDLKKSRLALHAATTPERERTRVLLELYRKLVATH